ncbi:RidA family protein [Nonomuraea sp. FMUSA5-5]|uniref:RidA family protein n=1 Tax=Nonomuraea composti TaxID=2720023 RepID=A0ABX1BP72_9ACTN|nr:RidA family protein [Nonomuraea sp. FMUSA5-5]NJP97071.1 RidA family protein [Nonomuraea sp. FMUSA5-5]
MPVRHLPPAFDTLPIAKASIAGSLVFCTVVPEDDSGAIVGASIVEQARVVFAKLAETLKECGCELGAVVHVTVYLPDIADRGGMTQVWREVFPDTPPARATIGVSSLAHPDIKIEITAIAYKGD